jgi:hypothetical protein
MFWQAWGSRKSFLFLLIYFPSPAISSSADQSCLRQPKMKETEPAPPPPSLKQLDRGQWLSAFPQRRPRHPQECNSSPPSPCRRPNFFFFTLPVQIANQFNSNSCTFLSPKHSVAFSLAFSAPSATGGGTAPLSATHIHIQFTINFFASSKLLPPQFQQAKQPTTQQQQSRPLPQQSPLPIRFRCPALSGRSPSAARLPAVVVVAAIRLLFARLPRPRLACCPSAVFATIAVFFFFRCCCWPRIAG